jgi:N-acetylglucosaminyldiphosphoundecaprenol N-acetyl-beta-D-mannosaminyltransferase
MPIRPTPEIGLDTSRAAPGPATVRLFELDVSCMTYAQSLEWIGEVLRNKEQRACIFSGNVDQVVRFHSEPDFRKAYSVASLVLPDGMPLVWCARGLGLPLGERVAGIDLLNGLCAVAAQQGHSCYFLGARPEVLAATRNNLRIRFPGLAICGSHHGYFSDDDGAILRDIEASKPSILFVGMGSPRQEFWLQHNFPRLPCQVALAVGGAFDVIGGRIRRAPEPVQKAGLEWLWRTAQEPKRLWRRYLVQDTRFFPILLKEVRHRTGRGAGLAAGRTKSS